MEMDEKLKKYKGFLSETRSDNGEDLNFKVKRLEKEFNNCWENTSEHWMALLGLLPCIKNFDDTNIDIENIENFDKLISDDLDTNTSVIAFFSEIAEILVPGEFSQETHKKSPTQSC